MARSAKPRFEPPVVVDPDPQAPPPATPERDDPELEVIDDDELGDLLELSDPSKRDWVWWVYRIRTQDEMEQDPKREPRLFAAKQIGPLDVMDIQRRYGGGRYELRGYLNKRLAARKVVELAQPRSEPAPPPPPAVPPPAPNGEVLTAITKLTEQVALLAARPAPTPVAQGLDIEGAIKLFTTLAGMTKNNAPPAASGDASMMKEMIGMFRDGVAMARESEGGGERSTAEILIEKLTPAVERIATHVLTARRVQPPIRRPAPNPTGSGAVVVEPPMTAAPPATAEPEREPVAENFRIMAAVDAFARAIESDEDPGDFSASLDHILNPAELDWLTSKTAEQVMAELAPVTAHYPVFKTDAALPFVQSVLFELRSEADEAPESTSAPDSE